MALDCQTLFQVLLSSTLQAVEEEVGMLLEGQEDQVSEVEALLEQALGQQREPLLRVLGAVDKHPYLPLLVPLEL